jgi:hypothetical protein
LSTDAAVSTAAGQLPNAALNLMLLSALAWKQTNTCLVPQVLDGTDVWYMDRNRDQHGTLD